MEALSQVKAELTEPTVLTLIIPTKISVDVLSYRLGAILQRVDNIWRPVVYASRAMSETERRYTETEALAVT